MVARVLGALSKASAHILCAGQGLDNVSIFDLIVFNKKWGRWGPRAASVVDAQQGPGKDTALAGPAIAFIARKGNWNFGLFNKNLFGMNTTFSSLQPTSPSVWEADGRWRAAMHSGVWIGLRHSW
jgi:hypothetical protein